MFEHEGRLTLEEVKALPIGTLIGNYNKRFRCYVEKGPYNGIDEVGNTIVIGDKQRYLSDMGLVPYRSGWNPVNCITLIENT